MNVTWKLCGLAALLCSCASTPTFEGAAQELGDDLLAQIESRKDLREIRLFIDEFEPCDRNSTGRVVPVSTMMGAGHRSSSRRLRHALMGVLAPRMIVLESDSPVLEGGSGQEDAFEIASALEASAILVGNYTMEGEDLLLMLRVIDVSDGTILAAAEALVPHGSHRSYMINY